MPSRLHPRDVFTTAPRLEIVRGRRGRPVKILNREFGVALEAPPEFIELLRFFRKPRSIAVMRKSFAEVPDEVIDYLIRHFLLFAKQDATTFRLGSVRQSDRPAMGLSITIEEMTNLAPTHDRKRFAVLGAGVDIGAGGEGGARHGPDAIRSVFPLKLPRSPAGSTSTGRSLPDTAWDLEFHRQVDLGGLELRDLGDVHYSLGESNADFGRRVTWFTVIPSPRLTRRGLGNPQRRG